MSATAMSTRTGRCLCGAVVYEGKGEPGDLHVCHCTACRRWNGGPAMAVTFSGGIEIRTPDTVNWFSSSDWAERGSCRVCGSALFYRLKDGDPPYINVSAGSLDDASVVKGVHEHIFVESWPAYYDFADDAPRTTGEDFVARFQPKPEDGP
jgi:hypothetical protein